MKTCVLCGGPLSGAQKKLCSKRCKNQWLMQSEAWQRAKRKSEAKPEAKARKAAREEARKVERVCEWCGQTWMVKPTRPSRYCSHQCAREVQLPAPTCLLPPGHPALPVLPLALPPGGSVLRNRRTNVSPDPEPRRFTSARCRWCSSFYVSVGWYKVAFCSGKCNRAYWKATRRAAKEQVEREPISRAAVFERDRWTCHLCGTKVKRKAQAPYDPRAATLDHVIPLSKGGPHTMANLRTAHFVCNSRKGNRGGSEQLMLIG